MRFVCLPAVALFLGFAAPARAGDSTIAALQVALQARGTYPGAIDGVAGPATVAAVRSAQRSAGLVVDGIAGPMTRRALGARPLGSRILGEGNRGWDVAELQFRLAEHGFPSGTFDGVFGPRTEAAVRRFQRWAGIGADGRAGPATVAALAAPTPRPPFALLLPVDGRLGDGFGPRGARFHTGLDFAAPHGAPVRAAAPGRVTWAGWFDASYGVVVVLDHGPGVRTWYAHLSQVGVSRGARVSAGTPIGAVGATGTATGPHLHFEVRIRGAAVDPRPALFTDG